MVKQQQIMLFYVEERLEISYGQDFVYVENHIISSESRGSDEIDMCSTAQLMVYCYECTRLY